MSITDVIENKLCPKFHLSNHKMCSLSLSGYFCVYIHYRTPSIYYHLFSSVFHFPSLKDAISLHYLTCLSLLLYQGLIPSTYDCLSEFCFSIGPHLKWYLVTPWSNMSFLMTLPNVFIGAHHNSLLKTCKPLICQIGFFWPSM